MYFVRLELTTGNMEFIIDDLNELEEIIKEYHDTYMGCQVRRIKESDKNKSR